MEGKEIKIGLYCYEEDYTHTIYLYYEGENEYQECFLNPINRAKKSDSTDHTMLKASRGTIQCNRYFVKDYAEDRKYRVTIESATAEIEQVIFNFKDDDSHGVPEYDARFIKDIELNFINTDCREKV